MNFQRSVKSLVVVLCSATLGSAFADRFTSTGAVVTQVDDAEVYAWTSTNEVGTIVVPDGGAIFDMLLVGGGGAGGFCRGGGGGGGGVLYQTGVFLEAGTYYIKVGAGGEPDWWSSGSYGAPASTEKTDGRPSTLSNATQQVKIAYGGGGGASFKGGVGRAGGSSGGCSYCNTVAPEGIVGQGNQGGATHVSNNYFSGGGGGAGGPGVAGSSAKSGDGGPGLLCTISGTNAWYGAGGGGGACSGSTGTSGAGGLGGGGHGGYGDNPDLTAGADGVGAGGGGASGQNNQYQYCYGRRGGNGIVIFRTAAASKPDFTAVQVVVSDATNITFSAALSGMGTDPQGSAAATGCDLYFAYGTDSNNLVSVKVKSGWTLDDNQWSMTVHDIPTYSRFYWHATVTNNLGVGVENEQAGVNLTTGFGTALPLKYGFSDPTVTLQSVNRYDLPALFDGKDSIVCNLKDGQTHNVLFDAGSSKSVKFVRALSTEDLATVTDLMQPFEIYGSNDRTNWTKVTDVDQFVMGIKSGAWMEAVVYSSTPFRYFEMRGLKEARLAELELISENMSLRFDKPQFYEKNGAKEVEPLAASYDTDGVTIAGKLMASPSSATEIYGYFADTDYDNDESAWMANGTKFTLSGTFASGATFSQKIKLRDRGNKFLRLFARAGSEIVSAQRSWEIALKSEVRILPMYVKDSAFVKMYDGDVTSSDDGGNRVFAFFDLRGLKATDTFSHIKFWPVATQGGWADFTWTRTRVGQIYVSYDDVEFTPTGTTLVEGREVYKIDAEPSMTWTLVKPYLDDMVLMHSYTECVYLGLTDSPRPTYLKIGNFDMRNCREVEFRVSTPPKGLAIIFR